MVMGPQILTAIFLVTSKQPVKNSIAMLIGVVAAASVSLLIWYGLSAALGISPPSGSGPSTTDFVVAGLLALAPVVVVIGAAVTVAGVLWWVRPKLEPGAAR